MQFISITIKKEAFFFVMNEIIINICDDVSKLNLSILKMHFLLQSPQITTQMQSRKYCMMEVYFNEACLQQIQ